MNIKRYNKLIGAVVGLIGAVVATFFVELDAAEVERQLEAAIMAAATLYGVFAAPKNED